MATRGLLVVTGAAGWVATLIRPLLRQRGWRLRLTDRRPVDHLEEDETFVPADLAQPAECDVVMRGATALLHLAAHPREASFDVLGPENVVATANVFASAARHQIRHVAFASSLHVIGDYPREASVNETSLPRPDSMYAATKVFGEAVGYVYAVKAGMTVTCLRLGHVTPHLDKADLGTWISPEDTAQLVDLALTRSGDPFAVVHALADYQGDPMVLEGARRLGYRCERPAHPFSEAVQRIASAFQDVPHARTRRGNRFACFPLPDLPNTSASPRHAPLRTARARFLLAVRRTLGRPAA